MSQTVVARTIKAPIERVFQTVGQIENFSRVIPAITRVDFLSDQRSGVGARFRETRRMGKREASTVLEVTEYVPNERVRLVSDAGGTIWDTVFTTRPTPGDAVELTMVMNSKPYRFLARLINPLIKGMLQRMLEKDLDAIKAACEGTAPSRPGAADGRRES